MVRRCKKDVLQQLPSKLRSRIFVDVAPTADSARLAAQLAHSRGQAAAKAEHNTLLTAFYLASAEAKCGAVRSYIKAMLAEQPEIKFLFFAHHTARLPPLSLPTPPLFQRCPALRRPWPQHSC